MKTTYMNYTPIQLKLPVDLERIIEINDSVYTFNEVVSHINLKKYFVEKGYKAEDCSGCPHRSKCNKSGSDRIIRLNYELTSIHK